MSKIRKATEFLRATVTQEIRVILEPEEGAPENSYRRVQFLVPPSPLMVADLDYNPEFFGLNRTYKLPDMPASNNIKFLLLPHQKIVAACVEGKAHATLIVEYLEGRSHGRV